MYCENYSTLIKEKMETVLGFYEKRIYRPVEKLSSAQMFVTKDHLRLPPSSGYSPCEIGTAWGGEWMNAWLRFNVTVPDNAAGKAVYVIPHTDAVETLCFINNKPAGIINSKNEFLGGMHSALFICENAVPGESYDIALECYAGHFSPGCAPFDSYGVDSSDDFSHTFGGIDICVLDKITRDFCFDLSTVLQLSKLPMNNFISKRANEALYNACTEIIHDVADYCDKEIDESCGRAVRALAPALVKAEAETTRGHVGLVGHSHMDTAWLWTVDETIRKCARTYSEVLALMDRYPEYTFVQSSALHLDFMREYYPDIFDGIKKRVAEGRYEPNGGVWVECDCNITGGESMIRQFLFGQRFTKEHFGYLSDTFWLPDTFGYNAAIPQIMNGCGIKYFCTTKMAWNDLNVFPADAFIWRGNDGSEVLTHLNLLQQMPTVEHIGRAVELIRDKSTNDKKLVAYGFGDGGGGPTEGMLEFSRRTVGLPGIPESHHTTVSKFMHELEADSDKLPLYDGELYLELHRGTLTSMHDIKRNNRKAEIALHNMELLGVMDGNKTSEKSESLWKTTLKNQFHDILPGSSISAVNDTAVREMSAVIRETESECTAFAADMLSDSGDVTFFNPSPFARNEDEVFVFGEDTMIPKGAKHQEYSDILGRKKVAIGGVKLEAYSMTSFASEISPSSPSPFGFDKGKLTTPIYDVILDSDGYIASLFDKRCSKQIAKGKSPLGALYFGENFPSCFDNWEIELDAFDKLGIVHADSAPAVVSDGEVELRLRSSYSFGHGSRITVDTVFYADSPMIGYEAVVDWHEKHALLKAGFDLTIRAPHVKNEIQFGYMERPTTRNNTIEAARFEVSNHKYSDLSETRYGVSILNDCKYGISVLDSNMMLTLQKSGTRPDVTGDPGNHEMKYALLPHIGSFSAENTVAPAYAFNYDVKQFRGTSSQSGVPLVKVSAPNVICETVKPAEDIDDAFVLRLYECERTSSNCTVTFPQEIGEAYSSNMLEEDLTELKTSGSSLDLTFTPFEIKTIIVKLK